MAKQVAIQDLKPGMFIIGVIEQNGPVKIRKSGLVTSHEMVQGLLEMGVISVAIDPEKTVEIEVEDNVHVSQTQFVMQANEESAPQNTDNHLAEQFNRSLFMPSLQKVPSAFQYYGSKVAVAVLMVILGFTSGWFASGLPQMLESNNAVSVSTDQNNNSEPDTARKNSPIVESGETISSTDANAGVKTPVTETASGNVVQQSTTNLSDVPQLAASATDTVKEETANIITNSSVPETTDEIEGEIVTQQASELSNSNVSPELLQRFEKAMADLEQESAPGQRNTDVLGYGETESDLSGEDFSNNDFIVTDVQRVDQLPARVMTRLPRMSFSAHMYASNPQDRWIKVNGIEMGEGEWLDEKVFVEKIEPQHVILLFEGHQFSMRALSEW